MGKRQDDHYARPYLWMYDNDELETIYEETEDSYTDTDTDTDSDYGFYCSCDVEAPRASDTRRRSLRSRLSKILIWFLGTVYYKITKRVMSSIFFAIVAILAMVPYDEVDTDSALVQMFAHVNAPTCKYIVAIGALSGLTVSMFGSMFPMPRVVYAMAQDGLIFRCFKKLWKSYRYYFWYAILVIILCFWF